MLATTAVKTALLYGLIFNGVSNALPANPAEVEIVFPLGRHGRSPNDVNANVTLSKRDRKDDFRKASPQDYMVKPDLEQTKCGNTGIQNDAPWSLSRLSFGGLKSQNKDNGVYSYSSTGKKTTLYMIGTGVDKNNKELNNRVRWAKNYVGGEDEDDKDETTGLAVLAAGTTLGVAKDAEIVVIKASGHGKGTSPQKLDAIVDFILSDRRMYGPDNPAVVHYGYNWEWTQLSEDPTKKLRDAGILFVSGAGDREMDSCQFGPAREGKHSGKIIVAASDERNEKLWDSNSGDCVDVYAPGADIKTVSAGNKSEKTISGTGAASAYVAGLACYFWQLNPTWTPADIKQLITRTSPINSVRHNGQSWPLAYNGARNTKPFNGEPL